MCGPSFEVDLRVYCNINATGLKGRLLKVEIESLSCQVEQIFVLKLDFPYL